MHNKEICRFYNVHPKISDFKMCDKDGILRIMSMETNAWMILLLKLYTQQQHSSALHAKANHANNTTNISLYRYTTQLLL